MDKKIIAFLTALLMFSSVFGLISAIPVASASPPASSASNTSYLNTSVSYWQNVAISNSATTNVNIPIQENSSFSQYSFGSGSSWTLSSNSQAAYWTQTFSGAPNYVYLNSVQSQNTLELDSIAFELGSYTATDHVYQELGTVYANMTIGGYTETWSHTFNFNELADSYYAIITPQWNFYRGTPWYLLSDASSATLSLTATTDGTAYVDAPIDVFTTTVDQGQNTIASSISTSVDSVPFAQGYYYGSSTSSFTPSSDLTSFDLSWSGPFSSTQVTYDSSTQTASSGTFTGNIVSGSQSVGFGISGDPSDGELTSDNYYVTGSYYLSSQVQAQQTSATQSYSSAQNPSENQNWWNSTSSFTLSPPSGALNNPSLATTSGTINAETTMTWSINHILSVGYGQSPAFDRIFYSGSDIANSSVAPSTQYISISQGSNVVVDSSTGVSYNFDEFINYHPSIVNSNVATPVNPLTPLSLYANSTEVISGEQQNLAVSANGMPYIYSSPTSSESLVSPSFYFHSTGQKTVDWYVHNDPNGNPYLGSELNSSVQTATVSVVPFSLTPSPVDYSSVGTSVLMSLAYNTQTSAKMTIINLTVNGVLEDRFQPDLASGTVKYDFSQPVSAPLLVTWQAVDQYGYSQSITFQYGSNLTPAEYSNKVTVLQSANATHSYPLTLSGVPNGTGFYQQLITISNPSSYGINKAGSNIQFTSGNNTLLYAWIQSINSTSMQVWVKNYYGNSVIDMQVLPSFENLFSPTGYLGEAPQLSSTYAEYDNGKYVFVVNGASYYWNFAGTSYPFGNNTYDPSVWVTTNGYPSDIKVDNGLTWITNVNLRSPAFPSFGTADLYALIKVNQSASSIQLFPEQNTGAFNSTWFVNSNNSLSTPSYSTPSITTSTDWNLVGSGISLANNLVYSQYNGQTSSYTLNLSQYFTSSSDTGSVGFYIYPGSKMQYAFYIQPLPNNVMPTFTIGTGSVFQANATTTSTLSGTPGQQYNSTFQYFSFQIPLAPGTNYTTVIWNSTWTLSNAYPSTFLPISAGQNYITFEDLAGFSFLQVQLIEPSSQINTMEQVQLSPYQEYTNESLVTFQSYFSLSVSYTPFQSAASQTIKPSSMGFSLPYGSTATADIYSPWHQLMGSSSFNVTSSFVQVNVPLNVTFAYFIDAQTNATFSGETISANGYNNSYLDPMVVANGSSYSYAVSTIDPQTYQLENYPGIFTAKKTAQKIYVNVGMPLASALVNVYAYNQSGLNELGNGGPTTGQATAYLYIGGVRQSLSSTFTGQLGETYPVKITDVLGNVLYTGNLTLNQPVKTVNINITTPSYAVQFINEEDVPASSPLAIQHSSLNMIGSDVYYNFSTRVGQQSTIYLATGEYHLYTHDNLTNSLNFSITNETVGFDFNGPNILRITEQAINLTNHGIILNPISQPGNLIPGQNATWLLEPEFKNGTLLSASEISNSTFQFIVTNSSGSFLPEIINHTVDQGYLRVTFLPTTYGSVTFAMKETFDNNSGSYSYLVTVTPVKTASKGLQESIRVPSTVQAKNSTVGTVFFSLTSSNSSNPITPNQAQTLSLLGNTSLELLYKGKFDGLLTAYYIQPGEGAFSLNLTTTGTGYSVLATTTPTNISGQKVSFTGTSQSFSVVSYNPTQQVSLTSQLVKALTGIDAEIFYLIVTVATVLYEIIKFLRRRDEDIETEENEAGLFMEAMTMFQVLLLNSERKAVPPELQEIYNKIPASRRNRIYSLITSRRKAILPKPKFLMKKPKEAKQNE